LVIDILIASPVINYVARPIIFTALRTSTQKIAPTRVAITMSGSVIYNVI